MFNRECRLGGLVIPCLLGLVLSVGMSLQTAHAADVAPATASSPSAPYSPVVSFGHLPALQVATPIPGSAHVPGDFNGDGTSDLLWFNPTLSQLGYWTMSAATAGSVSGSGVTKTGTRLFNVTPGYFVGAVGDFNTDGYADLIFTSANRDLWLWTNNQRGGFTSTEIGSYPSQWQLVGAGDINGDGYDDLLWLDPSDCEFAYWTMRGGARTGYKVIKIACGYYPTGIGYYSTSNRLSILWTSAANDLYIWDSTPTGFVANNLNTNLQHVWAFGGGYMGQGIGIESFMWTTDGTYDGGMGAVASRTFDAAGDQTGFNGSLVWDGGLVWTPSSAGYIIQSGNTNATGLYVLNQAQNTIHTNGLSGSDLGFSGNAPIPQTGSGWTYPVGWWVVGAPANGTAALPFQ